MRVHLHIGTLIVGKAIQGITTAYLTRIAGKSFIEYFRQDQDWGDGGITEVVQQQFQLIRKQEFVKQFVKDAIIRVIEPLKLHLSPDELEEEVEDLEPLEIPQKLQTLETDWDQPNSLQKDW